jgi:hypothetical protein
VNALVRFVGRTGDFVLFLLWQLPFAVIGFFLFWFIGYPWIAFRGGWDIASDLIKPNDKVEAPK